MLLIVIILPFRVACDIRAFAYRLESLPYKKNVQQEWNLDKLNPIQQTPQYNIHGIVVVKCMEQTHKLKMYRSTLLDWVLDFLKVLYFFPGWLCRFKAYQLFQWYINFIHSNYNPGQKSLGQYRNIHTFLSFLGSLLKQYILFEIFLLFSLPTPYTKLKLGKNSGYMHPTLFVRRRDGLDLCELQNAPETQVSQDFFHDCLKKRWKEKRQFFWFPKNFRQKNITELNFLLALKLKFYCKKMNVSRTLKHSWVLYSYFRGKN